MPYMAHGEGMMYSCAAQPPFPWDVNHPWSKVSTLGHLPSQVAFTGIPVPQSGLLRTAAQVHGRSEAIPPTPQNDCLSCAD